MSVKDKSVESPAEEQKTPCDVLLYSEPDLRRTCRKVRFVNDEMRKIIEDMIETMLVKDGLGIAAPQVGINKRFFLFISNSDKIGDDEKIRVGVAINPLIIERDGESITYEGCLSYPDYFAKVNRALKIKVRYHDIDMNKIEEELFGLAARVFQHELDHLDGILFIDRMEADTLKHADELDEKEENEEQKQTDGDTGG